ncbi:hypothetical protein SH2C18_34810 [Clostridium sediminicola]|uniref:DUF2251 domain-containing protein n=1 Tax=Clostridium sediminicola TaxID=3114879 RepID=UPI0031F2404B
MNSDLNQEEESYVIDSPSPNDKWTTVFEDNGETGYMYLCSSNEDGEFNQIVDHLWIYNKINPPIEECKNVFIIWSDDSNRTGLIVDGECWGIFDLSRKRKLNAPREKNMITSIEREAWDNGIGENKGEPLRLDTI